MNPRAALVVSLLAMALPLSGHADDTDKQVARAKACSDRAAGREFTDQELKAYLRKCMASSGPLPDPGLSLRQISRRCEAVANSRNLTGPDRGAFLLNCKGE